MKAFEYEERRFEVVEEDEFRPIDSHASPIGWRIHLPSRAPIELKKQILFHEAAEIAINSHYVALLWELKEFGLRGIYYRIKYIRDYTVIIPALTIGFFMYLLIKGDYLGIWVFGFLLRPSRRQCSKCNFNYFEREKCQKVSKIYSFKIFWRCRR